MRRVKVRQRVLGWARWLGIFVLVSATPASLGSSPAWGAQGEGEVVLREVDTSGFPWLMTTVSILGPSGRPIGQLDVKALRVSVDGRELQGLADPAENEESSFHLAKAGGQMASAFLVLAVDVSGSVKGAAFKDIREAAEGLLAGLTPDDRVALVTFGVRVERQTGLTADFDAVRRSLAGLTPSRSETVLYDAVCDAVDLLAAAPPGRKAIVVLSDGIDDGSRLKPEDCVQRAARSRATVYSLVVGSLAGQHAARTGLGRIAKLTGGVDFYRDGSPSVKTAPKVILEELKTQYVLSFGHARVSADGRDHQLTVAVQPSLGIGDAEAALTFAVPLRPTKWPPPPLAMVLIALVLVVGVGGAVWLLRPRHGAVLAQPLEGEKPPEFHLPVERTAPRVAHPGLTAKTDVVGFGPAPAGLAAGHGSKTELVAAAPVALSWFVEKEGKNPGRTYRVVSESFVIGRSAQADLSLADVTVSDKHARLRKEADRFIIYDLASTNGLFVNQEQVYSRALRDGDEVKVGNMILVFKEILEGPP